MSPSLASGQSLVWSRQEFLSNLVRSGGPGAGQGGGDMSLTRSDQDSKKRLKSKKSLPTIAYMFDIV